MAQGDKEKNKEAGAAGEKMSAKRAAVSGVAAILLSLLLIATPYVMRSYNVSQNLSYAQTPPAPSICPYWMPCCICVPIGGTAIMTQIIEQAKQYITGLVYDYMENFINDSINDLVGGILNRGQEMEENMEEWWDTFYNHDWRPALADMMAQLHTSRMDTTRQLGSTMDAGNLNKVVLHYGDKSNEGERAHRTSEHVCIAMTHAGGMGRTHALSRALRWGLEDERNNVGRAAAGTPAAAGRDALVNARWTRLANNFCNDDVNRGTTFAADCTPGPSGYDAVDADIKPASTLLESLTIPMTDPKAQAAVEQVVENIAGTESPKAMPSAELNTLPGQREYLEKRARLAKRAAAASLPLYSAGLRTEGSDMEAWVQEFADRTGSTIPVSPNPSYTEIMHAMTRYKPATGQYGAEMITTPLNIERERYIASSIYLINLRDYFEMLERVALTLAVDTALMMDLYASEPSDSAKHAPAFSP